MDEFKKLGLSDRTIDVLEKKGFTKPTSIQVKAIPLLLEGKKDVIGQSQTGTGKTASFALPILDKIKTHSKITQAIILTPTRELAVQVTEEINSLRTDKDIQVISIYGGASIESQRERLAKGADIVVGTPGRVIDMLKRKSLKLENIQFVVLDEADEMLNMGFIEDIEDILKSTPKEKTMLMFSATMPKPILNIAKEYMREFELIKTETANITLEAIEQIYYDVNTKDRTEALRRIIDHYMDFYGIIFCNTKSAVDTLTHQLLKLNYHAAALHGDITQSQREKILKQFRDKDVKILVATDVAARGIDVNDLTHVVNFSLPQSPEIYIHRIGRTGRAGKKGISITFVVPSEKRKLTFLEKINRCKLVKQELPSAKDIIANKESQLRDVIKKIIDKNAGRSSKYDAMAEDFLKEHSAKEVIAAILKYSFRDQLDLNSYKNLSEVKPGSDSGSGRSRSRRDRRGGRSGERSGDRSEHRSGQRSFNRSSGEKRSGENRSERKPFSGENKQYKKSGNKGFKKPEHRSSE